MIANYHTHTYRCHHAEGCEKEYIENAVRGGLKMLGFTDHTPYDIPFPKPFRMTPEELPGYVQTLRALAGRYRDQIEILTGVEVEYYPKHFPAHREFLRENGVRYMILGQHFLGNEFGEPSCAQATEDVSILERYVEQSTEALHTGAFTYFAHPDLIHYTGRGDAYARQMRRLCEAAKETGTPLEINLLGIRDSRHYPDERFWAIAGEVGNDIVLGCDAHRPADVCDKASERVALELVKKYDLHLLETVQLRRI